jgi:glycosyltransferase involved in cell wall biosynthesis
LTRVAIYRDSLLPPSETFIARQVAAFTRYEPFFVGTRRARPSLTLSTRALVLREIEQLPLLQDLRFRARMGVPRGWLAAIRHEVPVLLHSHFGTDGVRSLPLRRALGIPMVVSFHGFDITIRDDWSILQRAYAWMRPRVFREAAMVIATSHSLEQLLIERGCPREKIRVHYPGMDPRDFPAGPSSREPIVLFVGRFVEKKGCHDLLEAMRLVQRSSPGLHLVMVGSGPEEKALHARARELNLNCTFTGPLPPHQVADWMRRALLLCAPSVTASSGDSEAFPNVLLEAQSSGLPVVSTWHSGIPENVEHEVTGILVREHDAGGIAAAIIRLASDRSLWQSFSLAAHDRVAHLFDVRNLTRDLEALYDEVVEGAAHGHR